ncbi:undecaprenyl/decaprenyl-phosphate alpha-N-acetylglucosaminyl 1-phosphate transferase [Thermopolyspora sp. NPDC052614]|uniref:glycosyltransferase family 4 protein n=1 Tax=Thermopolyspora sp. NPDC052614 TaxID=3155682 RepID=UPI00342CA14D
MREYLLTALVTATVTYLLVPLVRRFALRIGAAPEVRERDVHTTPIPRLGGLAMFAGLVVGLLVASRLPYVGMVLRQEQIVMPLLVAGGLITLTGFLDDWWGMDAFIKLGGQIAAAGVLVYFGMSLTSIPVPGGAGYNLDSTLQAVVTILIVVISINAVNFVDGLDGLAAGIVAIAALATFAYSIALSWDIQDTRINSTAVITAVLIGMCAGFLPHNFHPAKIFMGDTGAMLLGLVLAASMIKVTPIDPTILPDLNRFPVILPMLVPVAVLVPPLADFLMAVVRRMSYGKSPFAADRGHLHHRLLDTGHSQRSAVLILYAWTFLFAFAVVGLSIFGVALIVFPFTVVLSIAVLMLMWLPKWRSRKGGSGGAHAAGGTAGGTASGAAGGPAAAVARPAEPDAGPRSEVPADPFAGVRPPADARQVAEVHRLDARRFAGAHPYAATQARAGAPADAVGQARAEAQPPMGAQPRAGVRPGAEQATGARRPEPIRSTPGTQPQHTSTGMPHGPAKIQRA